MCVSLNNVTGSLNGSRKIRAAFLWTAAPVAGAGDEQSDFRTAIIVKWQGPVASCSFLPKAVAIGFACVTLSPGILFIEWPSPCLVTLFHQPHDCRAVHYTVTGSCIIIRCSDTSLSAGWRCCSEVCIFRHGPE